MWSRRLLEVTDVFNSVQQGYLIGAGLRGHGLKMFRIKFLFPLLVGSMKTSSMKKKNHCNDDQSFKDINTML